MHTHRANLSPRSLSICTYNTSYRRRDQTLGMVTVMIRIAEHMLCFKFNLLLYNLIYKVVGYYKTKLFRELAEGRNA